MRKIIAFVFLGLLPYFMSAQMVVGVDTLYGNEWIDFSQTYYKIQVAQDGAYRLSFNDLSAAGVPVGSISGSEYKIYHLGEEIPIYVSSNGSLGSNDYITFFGEKNRTELEEYLFPNPSEMLHPAFSLFTDTSAYFLTWKTGETGLRYQEIQNDTTNHPAPMPYFLRKLEKNFQDYWAKKEGGSGSKFSHFDTAEGFSTALKTNQNHSFSPISPYLAGPDAQIHVRYAGRGADHHQEIRINDNLITTDEFSGWDVRDLVFNVSASELSSNVNFKMKGLVNANNKVDRSRIGVLSLTYPQVFDFVGLSNYVFELSSDGQYLAISNFDASQGAPVLYDKANGYRIEGKMSGSLVTFQLPQTTKPRELVLVSGEGMPVSSLIPMNFVDYASANSDYLMITNARLLDDGNGHNYVQEYADYRTSAAGGSYNPLIVSIQQVYDQFGYGVQRNPIGIRNMVQWVVRHWDKARFVYLIGKGRTYNDIRSAAELQAAQETMLVPTFGSPGGDNLFVTSNYDAAPRLAIGRLAATTGGEVGHYLDKIKLLEYNQVHGSQRAEEQLWKKRIIHLGGGSDAALQANIKNKLHSLENRITNNLYGGDVTSFFRAGTDPVQESNSVKIFKLINEGVSLITFFGHSSTGTLDLDIDNPEKYNNSGKFPLVISMGCYSGNIFSEGAGISERFVFYEDKAAIGVLASSGIGYVSALDQFVTKFYDYCGGVYYGKSIGEILQVIKTDYKNSVSGVGLLRDQYTLHGDPAVKLSFSEGPDYIVSQNVTFSPQIIDSQVDTFLVGCSVLNLGKGIEDSIQVVIRHVLPNGQPANTTKIKIAAPKFKKELEFKFANPGKIASGKNTLFIEVDDDNEVVEWPSPDAEMNNTLISSLGQEGQGFFIFDNSAKPIWPYEYSIVSKSPVLVASTTDPLAKERRYIFEIDKVETFNSPSKSSTYLTQKGGLLKWQPSISWEENTVYYWRISPDSLGADEGFLWAGSSFLYLSTATPGWNQSDYGQYQDDLFGSIVMDTETKTLKFKKTARDIKATNGVSNGLLHPTYFNEGQEWWGPFAWPIYSGVEVIVFDSISGLFWLNDVNSNKNGKYGSICVPSKPNPTWGYLPFAFRTDTYENRIKLLSFLRDTIPAKSFVMLNTLQKDVNQDFVPEDWALDSVSFGANLYSLLEDNGAQLVRQLEQKGSVPYGIIYRKGEGVLSESIADSVTDYITIEAPIPGRWYEGSCQTTTIGPAISWESLEWSTLKEASDSINISVWGLNAQDTVLLKNPTIAQSVSLSDIDANQYPYLRLEYYAYDLVAHTVPPIEYLRVNYQPYPEVAVNPNGHWLFESDSLNRGERLRMQTMIENVSDYGMDSLLVSVVVIDKNNQERNFVWKEKPMQKQDTALVEFELATEDYDKVSNIILELNPANQQVEQVHFNNFVQKGFYVHSDDIKPVLDVTFDGIRIFDGDLVSAEPEIVVILDDENEYYSLADTSLIRMSLVYPDGSLRKIYFDEVALEFVPASTSQNIAKVIYRPVLMQDGEYQLVISAKDVAGNVSGDAGYQVGFKIIRESMVSNVLAYPNPFSSGTRFAYTLTGSQVPDVFMIRVMTVAGKVVREITQAELGDLKIGKHLTDYVWDGTDEYGDKLANGVYLYELIVKHDGESIKKYDTNTDTYFKKGLGKLLIMR